MISMLPVNVPLDIPDDMQLLVAVHEKIEMLKRGHVAELVVLLGKWLGAGPAGIEAALGALGNVLPLPLFNMVCTSVPGPQFPIHLFGREMLTYYPYVPIGQEMGFNVAIESYNGKLYFGLAGDSVSVPDLDRLKDFIGESFAELKQASTVPEPEQPESEASAATSVLEPVSAR
jgi:hypothetical protein